MRIDTIISISINMLQWGHDFAAVEIVGG